MTTPSTFETDFTVGPEAIEAYSRLSYTMWYALAEFIDNSTQSRANYSGIIDDVLRNEGQPLTVEIVHNRTRRELSISDNSIGMTRDDLVAALHIAHRTRDSIGRSRYGMGMKTAACWIGRRWRVVTCEWGSGEEWTAEVDVNAIVRERKKILFTSREVSKDDHYTKIIISDLHRNIQARTEDTIKMYLGSMYRYDLARGRLKLLYNGDEIKPFDELLFDTDPSGKPMRRDLPPLEINGKSVSGWVGILRKGGRKYGGFSLFQNERQIQGFPNAWKPKSIFGGVDDEGANNLVAQRLTGVLELDGFHVSHTKDAILYEDDEEEQLEKFLFEFTKDYRDYARKRRDTERGRPWSREKIRDLLDSMKKEFTSPEMKDAVNSILPPIETILSNNQRQLHELSEADTIETIDILPDLRVIVSLVEKSEYEPYVTIAAGADAGTIHVIINGLHPYYSNIESADAVDECLRQYILDAVAEYRASKLNGKVNPNSVRRLKDELLRADVLRLENAAATLQEREIETIISGGRPSAK
ncbi:MAG: ATP-binding protein [Bryobacteraceae bacterium]|nr:ATP-binding protein [Bryobacteraceae bacterium]